jgi:DNA-directed RNA polymerase specialized sigma24 family protein
MRALTVIVILVAVISVVAAPGLNLPRTALLWYRMTLTRAADELPPGYRLSFLLHDVYGCEHHEIAAILCC